MSSAPQTAPMQPALSGHEVTIRPPSRWGSLGLRELFAYHELIYFLMKRELQIRYKQSLFGISWAVLQPVALTFIFAVFFGRLAKVPSEDLPYPIFAMGALVPWTFASQGVTQSAGSLVADANLLSKVYFPRLAIPVAKVVALLLDLVIALGVLSVFMVLYSVPLRPTVLIAPAFLLLAFATTLGIGLFLAAVNVKYRDVNLAVPLAVQIWLFATPVVYPGSLITGVWKYLYALNPMVSVINGVRWAFLATPAPAVGPVAISAASALVILTVAALYFRQTERFFADIV